MLVRYEPLLRAHSPPFARCKLPIQFRETPDHYDLLLARCRELFLAKTHDYGTAWRILRLPSVTDQIYIKANRIRTIQETGVQLVADDVNEEFVAIVNYCLIALMQLHLPRPDTPLDMTPAAVADAYDREAAENRRLLAGQKPRLRRSLAPDARSPASPISF